MATATATHAWTCRQCKGTRETKSSTRIPQGWKRDPRDGVGTICPTCWRNAYTLRAVALRIAEPLTGDWPKFRAALKSQWIDMTALANWVTTQCYVRDCRREPAVEKMPKYDAPYLYPEGREKFPNVPSQSLSTAIQSYIAKYKASRYNVIWTSTESLRHYRYPEPFVCHNQSWKLEFEGDQPVVSVRIGDGRWRLRLKGGPRYHRQIAALHTIIDGSAVKGELAIFRKKTSSPKADTKVGGSGAYIKVKMVAWFPKKTYRARSGTLHVRTDKDALLVALNAKDERIWVYNADQARRWVAEHRRRISRLSEDQKAEQRPVPSFEQFREQSARKFRDRMNSLIRQVAASVVGYADRRRMLKLEYNDSKDRFLEQFPYHELKSRISVLCNECGIEFASGGETEKSQ